MITVNPMYKLVTVIFIFLLLLVTPVYAGSSFQYSKTIETDNLMGYKSIILDKAVNAHSNHFSDLRVINEKGEEIPYFITSILDASTDTEKSTFILSEEAQYITTEDGTDSIITIQLSQLNAFRLELNTDNLNVLTYGLFGLNDGLTSYLSDGEIFNRLPTSSAVNKEIEWTNNPPIDKLKLIIHNRNGVTVQLKSVTIKYHLNKLVFKDPGNSQLSLAYGNDTLRPPIYETLNNKDILKGAITPTQIGSEIKNPSTVDTSATLTKYQFFSKYTLAVMVLLILFGLVFGLRKKKQ